MDCVGFCFYRKPPMQFGLRESPVGLRRPLIVRCCVMHCARGGWLSHYHLLGCAIYHYHIHARSHAHGLAGGAYHDSLAGGVVD